MRIDGSGAERRRHERTEVALETDIRYEGLDCTGLMADVSRSGALVRATEEADPILSLLQPGDWVELSITLEQPEPVSIPARVVRKQTTGVGFEFLYAEPRLSSSQLDLPTVSC